MKCRLTEKKTLIALLVAGLALMAAGAAAGWLLPESMHLAARIAGFVNGLGLSLAVMGGALLLRQARLGEQRARDAALAMNDERGLAVAYKAQNAAAIAAVFALAIMTLVALVEDDELYMTLGAMLLCAVALVKLAAWYLYNRRM